MYPFVFQYGRDRMTGWLIGYVGTACVISAELLVQVLTWKKTSGVQRTLRQLHIQQPFTSLLLGDGSSFALQMSCKWDLRVLNRHLDIFVSVHPDILAWSKECSRCCIDFLRCGPPLASRLCVPSLLAIEIVDLTLTCRTYLEPVAQSQSGFGSIMMTA